MSSFASLFTNTNFKTTKFAAQHIPKDVPQAPQEAPQKAEKKDEFTTVKSRYYVPREVHYKQRVEEPQQPVAEKKSYYKTTNGSSKSTAASKGAFKGTSKVVEAKKVDTYTEAKVVMLNKPISFD